MHPRDLARIGILVSVGTVALAVALWAISFGAGGATSEAGSPMGAVVLLGGLVVMAGALLLLGGAGMDAVWGKLQDLRQRGGARR